MDAFEEWLKGFSPDTTTPDTYSHYFREFLSWLGMTADQVLEKRQKDLVSSSLVERVYFENKLKQYEALLKSQGKSKSIRLQVWKAAKSFFSSYGVPLQLRKQDTPRGEDEEEIRPFTKKEIRQLLAVSDPMQRALVLTFKDTGLSSCDLERLKIQNLEGANPSWREALDQDKVPVAVTGHRKKTRGKFQTFLGYESAEALQIYFEQREKGTAYLDWLDRGVQPEDLNSQSYVFRCKTKMKRLTGVHIQQIIMNLIKKAGLRGVSSHGFRRFFKTTLENPELGIHPTWVKRMMGHKLEKIEKAYSHPTEQALREARLRAEPFLSIMPRSIDEERLTVLETEVEDERRLRERSDDRIVVLERMVKHLLRELEKDEEFEAESV